MPNLHPPCQSEFTYLRDQRTHALAEIQSSLVALGAALKEGSDPQRWATSHPWATVGTAFGLGLTAGYVVTPTKHHPAVTPPTSAPQPSAVAPETVPPVVDPGVQVGDAPSPVGDKIFAGAKSLALGAAYGLGRLALNQILDGLMAGMHPPAESPDNESTDAGAQHAESFSWPAETSI